MIPQYPSALAGPNVQQREQFAAWLWSWFVTHRRSFVWREQISPYGVFVSEVMLQQTQTARIAQRFEPFIKQFNSFASLAAADNTTILHAWQGLGYNRRAIYLRDAARIVQDEYGGLLPQEPAILGQLPGIGPATAASIAAFAFEYPSVFVETNIRSLLLYVFFPEQSDVSDALLCNVLTTLLPKKKIREWYYALTDAGVLVKELFGNQNTRSSGYAKQSTFVGSRRQVRGMILKQLLQLPFQSGDELASAMQKEVHIVKSVLEDLEREGLVRCCESLWSV